MNPILLLVLIILATAIYFAYKTDKFQKIISNVLFYKILVPLKLFFNDYYSNKGLTIDDIAEDHIVVNTMYKNLYGIKIEGTSNTPKYLDKQDIKELIDTYSSAKNSFFWYVIFKDGIYHRQYIFSYNKNLIKTIADKYALTLLTGEELANVILDLFLQNLFYVEDKDIHRTISLNFDSKLESNYQIFSKLAKENIYQNLNKTDVYQSYKALEIDKTNISNLFKMNFDGVIWNYFDISRNSVERQISKIINQAKWTGKKSDFLLLKEAYDSGEIKLAIANSTAHFKRIDESILGRFGTALKVNFIKKDIFKNQTLQKTPLKFRDSEFDFLVSSNFLENYISCVHKGRVRNADFFGFDKNGGFTNYSFAKENENPHAFIVANSGAGKSFTLQKILTTMLDVDYETAKAKKLDKDTIIVRYYDIGFSNDKLVNFLKKNPENNIVHIESNLSNFSYNIANIDETDKDAFEEDLIFSSDLVNLILSSQPGTETMSLEENSLYKNVLRGLYVAKDFQFYRIRDIKNDKMKNQILSLGYKENDYLKDLNDDYNFLKKPLLIDVVKYVKRETQNQQISEEIRENYSSLYRKLKAIDNLGIFSTFDTDDVVNSDFLSMDLNNFKENSLFVPIFVSIFQKTYLKDRGYAIKRKKENLSISKKLYLIEESANYFRVPYFKVLLEKLALEARKYGVHLILIAQQLSQIPKEISEIADTRIFLINPDKKNEFIHSISTILQPGKDVIDRLNNTDKYELCIWYSKGVFNMKLDINEFENSLFTTNPNDIKEKTTNE